MANDTLRGALRDAGLAPDDLAQIAGVDVRTVRRWLSGGTPYARQRGKVARALDLPERDLWPHAAPPTPSTPPPQPSDLLAAYPAASDLAAPDWKALMRGATDRIDLLGDTLSETLGTPGVPELLAAKATHGCAVRILTSDTGPHLTPLLERAGIEIRLLELPAAYIIHRYDDELLLTLHLVGDTPDHRPLLHLRRAAPGGMFDRLAEYYDDLSEHGSQPLEPRPGPRHDEDDEDDDLDSNLRVLAGEQPAAGPREPSAARRWPGRPPGPPDHG